MSIEPSNIGAGSEKPPAFKSMTWRPADSNQPIQIAPPPSPSKKEAALKQNDVMVQQIPYTIPDEAKTSPRASKAAFVDGKNLPVYAQELKERIEALEDKIGHLGSNQVELHNALQDRIHALVKDLEYMIQHGQEFPEKPKPTSEPPAPRYSQFQAPPSAGSWLAGKVSGAWSTVKNFFSPQIRPSKHDPLKNFSEGYRDLQSPLLTSKEERGPISQREQIDLLRRRMLEAKELARDLPSMLINGFSMEGKEVTKEWLKVRVRQFEKLVSFITDDNLVASLSPNSSFRKEISDLQAQIAPIVSELPLVRGIVRSPEAGRVITLPSKAESALEMLSDDSAILLHVADLSQKSLRGDESERLDATKELALLQETVGGRGPEDIAWHILMTCQAAARLPGLNMDDISKVRLGEEYLHKLEIIMQVLKPTRTVQEALNTISSLARPFKRAELSKERVLEAAPLEEAIPVLNKVSETRESTKSRDTVISYVLQVFREAKEWRISNDADAETQAVTIMAELLRSHRDKDQVAAAVRQFIDTNVQDWERAAKQGSSPSATETARKKLAVSRALLEIIEPSSSEGVLTQSEADVSRVTNVAQISSSPRENASEKRESRGFQLPSPQAVQEYFGAKNYRESVDALSTLFEQASDNQTVYDELIRRLPLPPSTPPTFENLAQRYLSYLSLAWSIHQLDVDHGHESALYVKIIKGLTAVDMATDIEGVNTFAPDTQNPEDIPQEIQEIVRDII